MNRNVDKAAVLLGLCQLQMLVTEVMAENKVRGMLRGEKS